MAVQESVVVYGTITGLSTGSRYIGPITLPAPASPNDATSGQTTTVILASGDNTITIPSNNCTAAIITFGSTSATTKKIKGAGGDTGITVNPTGTLVLSFPGAGTTAASFIINSSATDTGITTEIQFL